MIANSSSHLNAQRQNARRYRHPLHVKMAAQTCVFDTVELCEDMLLYLPIKDLVTAIGVCEQFRNTVTASSKLRQVLFLEPRPRDATPVWMNPMFEYPLVEVNGEECASPVFDTATEMRKFHSQMFLTNPPNVVLNQGEMAILGNNQYMPVCHHDDVESDIDIEGAIYPCQFEARAKAIAEHLTQKHRWWPAVAKELAYSPIRLQNWIEWPARCCGWDMLGRTVKGVALSRFTNTSYKPHARRRYALSFELLLMRPR